MRQVRVKSLIAASLLAAAVLPLGTAGSAEAQQPELENERGVPVYARARPELEPLGLRAGAFMIKPQLRLGATYDDNIYATPKDKEGDFITTLSPGVAVESNWSRHSIRFNASGTAGFYADNSSENFFDGRVGLDGRLDVLRETYLRGQLNVARLHEERGDPDVPDANDEPSVYYLTDARVDGYHGAGRLSLRLGTGFARYNYTSVDLVGGGSRSQAERDRNIYQTDARLAYELLPNVIPFVQAEYNWRRYDSSASRDRNSQGYRIGIGSGFDAGGIVTGEVFAGYMRQSYDGNDLNTASGLWFGGGLLWSVTRLTSVELGLRRSVEETQTSSASSYNRTALTSRVDHELLRNLLIGAYADYTDDRYSGRNIHDRYFEAGPRVSYLWNRNLTAEFSVSHTRKDSNIGSREYKSNRVFLAITGQF